MFDIAQSSPPTRGCSEHGFINTPIVDVLPADAGVFRAWGSSSRP
ncbi:hypothetical protein ACWD1Z_32815 [Streptomyces sp. NPDC002784]